MANVSANTLSTNAPDYLGTYFSKGNEQTPIVNLIGGINGGAVRTVNAMKFPMSQHNSLEAAAQPAITEAAASDLSSSTPTTYVREEAINTTQIFQELVNVSYVAQSENALVSGVPLADGSLLLDMNEKDFQIMRNMDQIMVNYEYSLLRGTYQAKTLANAPKMGGLLTSISTNTENAAGAAISRTLINTVLQEMWDANGFFNANTFIICGSTQKIALSDLYAHEPEDRQVAGANITRLVTDFGDLRVIMSPHMPATSILIVQMDKLRPVVTPVNGQQLFYEDLEKRGASDRGHVYGQLGIDFMHESFHGSITNLAS